MLQLLWVLALCEDLRDICKQHDTTYIDLTQELKLSVTVLPVSGILYIFSFKRLSSSILVGSKVTRLLNNGLDAISLLLDRRLMGDGDDH